MNDIWLYTFKRWSEKQADKYYASLKSACIHIAENPHLGKFYKDIQSNLCGLKIGKHIIFYISSGEDEIEIVRILHEQMDLKHKIAE